MKRSLGAVGFFSLLWLLLLPVVATTGCREDRGTQLSPFPVLADNAAEPDPMEVLGEFSTFIKAQRDYSFEALVTYQSLQDSGQTLTFDLLQRLVVSPPDRLFWETIQDDARITRAWFGGGEFTMFKLPDNIYGRIETPNTIPEMIDRVTTEYGIVVPFSDLLSSGRAPIFLRDLEASEYVGPAWVAGAWTHHLALRNALVDFEVWMPMAGDPVPSKLAITWKLEEGRPQYVARFRKWNFSPTIMDSQFRFDPPGDAELIEIIPASADDGAGS